MSVAAALHPSPRMPLDIRWMNALTTLLVVIALGMVALAGLRMLARTPFFGITQVTLDGELKRNNIATVRANIVPRVEGNFFRVDLPHARKVFEGVPWVRQATVRRVWPNELRVTLVEHQPAAYWDHDDRDDELVNTLGEIFEANLGDVEDEPLPTLRPPAKATADHARTMLEMLHRLVPVFKPMDAEITVLTLDDRGAWTVKLDNDAEIALGRGELDEVIVRTERFVKTLPELQRQYAAPLAYADLRYPQGYAVRLRGMSTLGEGQKLPVKRLGLNAKKP